MGAVTTNLTFGTAIKKEKLKKKFVAKATKLISRVRRRRKTNPGVDEWPCKYPSGDLLLGEGSAEGNVGIDAS